MRRPPPAARAVIGIRAGFRKREEADGCSNGCDRAEREEGRTVACLDDDQSSQCRRKRSPDALRGDDGALRNIEAAGVAHEFGDDHGKYSAKDSGADTVEKLDANQPCGIIGQGIERAANGEDE